MEVSKINKLLLLPIALFIFAFFPFDTANAVCGDGIYNPGAPDYEECEVSIFGTWSPGCYDDSYNMFGLGCKNRPGWFCNGSCTETCGDGIVQATSDELCDNGSWNETSYCPYTTSDPGSCDSCINHCDRTVPGTPQYCGDSINNGPEQCDDGNSDNNDSCTNACLDAVCGDGFQQPGETCDPFSGGSQSDTAACDWAGGPPNVEACTLTECGDGYLNATVESCDNGGANTNDPNCSYGPSSCSICNLSCGLVSGTPHYCGDGTVDSANGEVCDDGDNVTETSADCPYGFGNCNFCRSDCGEILSFYGGICGDGTVQSSPNNICAGGSNHLNTCINAGDCPGGICTPVEVCDDGDITNNGTCNSICTALTYCGDGVMQSPNGNGENEQCDDGNTVNGDGCNADCTLPVCGNGFVESGEECDGDGAGTGGETATCDLDCTAVVCGDGDINSLSGEECEPPNSGSCNSSCVVSVCGNGFVESGEECDGDGAGTGGETATCDLDCTTSICGDNTINTTTGEQCEPPGGPGCNGLCLFPICGNNVVDSGEECDEWTDENPANPDTATCDWDGGDGTNACTFNVCGTDGYLNDFEVCDPSAPVPFGGTTCASLTAGDPVPRPSGNLSCITCNAIDTTGCYSCGNGIIEGPELCDDGNLTSGDGCENTCFAFSPGWSCSTNPAFDGDGNPAESVCALLCGNGNPSDPGEVCDDGNNIDETIDSCTYGAGSCSFCNSDCSAILNFTPPYCGDGAVDTGADFRCSGGANNGNPCVTPSDCPSGLCIEVEVCDFGVAQNNNPNCSYGSTSCNVCLNDCSIEQPGITSYCGDGIYDPGNEECDYGGVGCNSACEIEDGYACGNFGPGDSYICIFHCGGDVDGDGDNRDTNIDLNSDGIIDVDESCDAGTDNGLRCEPNNYGENCDWCTSACESRTVVGDYCGDGEINAPYEECDQGNTVSGDGCSALCQVEAGWNCVGNRDSVCSPVSGDGICIGAPYETCTNNFNDCGACSIGDILTALPGQTSGVFNSIVDSISNIFPIPQLRINIPGLNLNRARVSEEIEVEVQVNSFNSRTPFFVGDREVGITISPYDELDPDNGLVNIILD